MRHFIHLKIGFLLLALFLINSACQRIDYTLELKQVDSLHQEVNHLLVELDSIDSTTVMAFSLILDEDTQWLSDSLSQRDLLLASDFLHQIKIGRLLIRNFPSEYAKKTSTFP